MKRTIAIVEDEKDLNELMKRYLEKEGYLVKSFYTYESALQHTGDKDIDLWLLDIMLDEKSGFDLFEVIKSQRDDVPMIFISARDKEFDRIIGLEKGSDDYITKPFNMKEVVLRVNKIIQRFYREEEKFIIDGYAINETQRTISDGEEIIDLTTKEFDLLMLFVHKKGVALSREGIITAVWGEGYYGSDRVVDDTLRRLRKKMPKLNINTLHGYGYKLG
ncbi:MAG TPA: response regulator transcription factor [Erysipelotrichaceae bacterium]|jgi:two-component system response regulator CssR|nr:response regulator transcription factor [Erysipelotrichia bacterium]HPX32341.1 response regulator transcription factor [Erysipelotrichaceae bacterium]HQA84852.1 response regulator transcription factor [Erysipelotrichaceae bacterium]